MKRLNDARILMYSHDTFGLGHLRRCRTIAHALVDKYKGLNVLIISGSQIAGAFDFKARVDFVKIPSVIKLYSGDYTSISEHIDIKETLQMRESLIFNTAELFNPDIFLIDKEPLGLHAEVESTLVSLQSKGCKTVLGLRDVMDAPEFLAKEWEKKDVINKVSSLYDEIWIYGSQDFWNPLQGLDIPQRFLSKTHYMGFLQRQIPESERRMQLSLPDKFILVTAGGGGDGEKLMSWVLDAREYDKSITYPLVMVTGPFMKAEIYESLRKRAESLENVMVIDFDNELENIIQRSTAIIGMCGYNTFCEMISFDRPALYVPRKAPRSEQLIRATRATDLGIATMLDTDNAESPAKMAQALRDLPTALSSVASGLECRFIGLTSCMRASREFNRFGIGCIGSGMKSRIAIFLKGYPRVSETFIAQEIALLEQSGLELHLISLRHPTDTKRHKVHDEITSPILYLPEYIHHEPIRCLKAWIKIRKNKNYKKARNVWLKDLKRDFTRNRLRRFAQAIVTAAELDTESNWFFYSHFIHTPASVARYASIMCQTPFSISAHAKDIWTSPEWELEEKIKESEWIVTCTKGGADYLRSLTKDKDRVRLLYHGLDLNRFPQAKRAEGSNGSDPSSPVKFLSIGRMVEKKGFDTLLRAFAQLDSELNWQWTHIGSGPHKARLQALSKELNLTSRLHFEGTQSQDFVLDAYRHSDLFILPSRIAGDGDRDGLPNVIVEAQSQALAVISTTISGIPELIESGINGILVEPDDISQLSRAISDLAQSPDKRLNMGIAGESRVRKEFDSKNEIKQLLDLFAK